MDPEVFYPLRYVEKTPAPHPLVVFNHGFLVSAFGYSSYAEQLVSHGFAIALPSFPTSFLNVNHATLAEDVRSVIDHLLEASEDPDHPLFGRIDPDRIHSSGHSLEGKLGLLEPVTDERVGAIAVLDAVDEGNPLWSDPVRYPSVASELMPTSTFRNCSSEGSSERFSSPSAPALPRTRATSSSSKPQPRRRFWLSARLVQDVANGRIELREKQGVQRTGTEEVATMLKPGDTAPSFELLSDSGKTVRLSDFKGQRVIVYFYPKADTPGCTKQACAIQDIGPQIEDAGVTVIGISPDPPEKLAKFRDKYGLGFILASDPDHEAAEAYGAWGEKSMYGKRYMGILRSHAAIDQQGRIVAIKSNIKPLETAKLWEIWKES